MIATEKSFDISGRHCLRPEFSWTHLLHPAQKYNSTCPYFRSYLLNYSMYQITSWKRDRFSANQKFPAFYGIRMFVTAFTSGRHLSLFCDTSIEPMPQHPFSWRSICILTSHLRLLLPLLPSVLFPPGFPHHKRVCGSPLPHTRYIPCPSHSSLFDHPNNLWWWAQVLNFLIM